MTATYTVSLTKGSYVDISTSFADGETYAAQVLGDGSVQLMEKSNLPYSEELGFVYQQDDIAFLTKEIGYQIYAKAARDGCYLVIGEA